jgi:hypothetical protein
VGLLRKESGLTDWPQSMKAEETNVGLVKNGIATSDQEKERPALKSCF